MADLAEVGFVAKQQAEGVEGDGFAGTGFAGKYGKAVVEIQIEFIDNNEIAEGKRQEHSVVQRVKKRLYYSFK